MAFNVSSFKTGNPFGGARPSNFIVTVNPPSLGLGLKAGIGEKAFAFRCRTSQLPGRTISTSEVPYMGRTIKLNGAPTYEDMETTIYEDEDFSVHELIIRWMDRINSSKNNLMDPRAALIAVNGGYFGHMKITVTSKTGIPIRQVVVENAWPTVLGPAELDWANNDEILNFPVTWALSNWTWSENVVELGKGLIDPNIATVTAAGIVGSQLGGVER
tara:strand:+ start:11672 stop:12319 length:648 start_codon:yes stop_codon:yes gene_type:complete